MAHSSIKRSWTTDDIPSIKESEVRHDKNFNNKNKILLEHALARAIIEHPTEETLARVHEVTATIMPFIAYLKTHDNAITQLMNNILLEHVGASCDQFMRDDAFGPEYRPTLLNTSKENLSKTEKEIMEQDMEKAMETLVPWLEKMLTKTDPTPNELLSIVRIHLAFDYVLFDGLLDSNKNPAPREEWQALISNEASQNKLSEFSNKIFSTLNSDALKNRGRLTRTNPTKLTKQYGLFPNTVEKTIQESVHLRGMDLFRCSVKNKDKNNNEMPSSIFVDRAIWKDIPLVCSISTTALRLLRFAAVMTSMSVNDYWDYVLPHLSYNILGGHHTFHEYASVMALVGIPYNEGEYKSLFLEDHPVSRYLSQNHARYFSGTYATSRQRETLNNTLLCDAGKAIYQHYADESTPEKLTFNMK